MNLYNFNSKYFSISPLVMGKISINDPIVNITEVQQTWEEMMNNQQYGPDLPLCPSALNGLFPALSIIPVNFFTYEVDRNK